MYKIFRDEKKIKIKKTYENTKIIKITLTFANIRRERHAVCVCSIRVFLLIKIDEKNHIVIFIIYSRVLI